ncbi:hypothetical protein TKK_0011145 [Trichogramma kaykai]
MVIMVEILDESEPKPFLGGWRDAVHDIEYHDAVAQTSISTIGAQDKPCAAASNRCKDDAEKSRSVCVQTIVEKRTVATSANSRVSRSVQADPGYRSIPVLGEIIIDVDELKRRREASSKIQRCFRAYLKRRNRQNRLTEKNSIKLYCPIHGMTVKKLENHQHHENANYPSASQEVHREKLSPKPSLELCHVHDIGESESSNADPVEDHKTTDISALRALIDRCWREIDEESKQKSNDKAVTHRVAQQRRLQREINILRVIETAKTQMVRRKDEWNRAKFLDELAKPVVLENRNQSLAKHKRATDQSNAMNAQFAIEYRKIYNTLMLDEEDDEKPPDYESNRVETLYCLKKLACRHTCAASISLENLIDQELFLLSLKVDPKQLRSLRSRIKLGFLRLARSTLKHDVSVPAVPKTRWCPSCTRVRRLEAFELDHRERPSRLCIDCKALRASRRAAVEANQVPSEQYERMLKELRRSEAARPDGATSLAFALGPNAIRYLVRDIWHGRSAISQSNQADELCLARLDPRQPWSPWNCLLATRREARMHEALARDDLLAGVYDQELLRKFRRMNMQARLYFETVGKPAYSSIFS